MYADQHNRLGVEHYRKSEYFEAIREFKRALEMNGSYVEALVNLGVTYSDAGVTEEAVKAFRMAEALDEGFVSCYGLKVDAGRYVPQSVVRAELGWSLLRENKKREAVRELKKAVEMNPDFPDIRVKLGNALLESGEIDDALAQAREALVINPRYRDAAALAGKAHYMRGIRHIREGVDCDAMAEFRRSVAADPETSPVSLHIDLGLKRIELNVKCEACTEKMSARWKYCPWCGMHR